MESKEIFGTRNGPSVANAKIVTESAIRAVTGMTAYKNRYGNWMIAIELDNDRERTINFPWEPKMVLEWSEKVDDRWFTHRENVQNVQSLETDDAPIAVIGREDVIPYLSTRSEGTKVRANMENGFVRRMRVVDAYKAARAKLRVIVYNIGSEFGVRCTEIVKGTGFEKVITDMNGTPISAEEFAQKFREAGIRPRIRCSLTKETNHAGVSWYSVYGIYKA